MQPDEDRSIGLPLRMDVIFNHLEWMSSFKIDEVRTKWNIARPDVLVPQKLSLNCSIQPFLHPKRN